MDKFIFKVIVKCLLLYYCIFKCFNIDGIEKVSFK